MALSALLVLSRGKNTRPQPPSSPKPVNAQVPDHVPIYSERRELSEQADVGILAYCQQVKQYAKTARGDWTYHWFQVSWDVIRTTQGTWEHQDLVFVCYDSRPTPESGILLKKGPFPYRQGMVYHFWIDATRTPPLLVRQQERSRLRPHGSIQPLSLKLDDPEGKKIYGQVMEAVRGFIGSSKEHSGGIRIAEELDDRFVVEGLSDHEFLVVTVDKDTYEVRRVPPPSKSR